MTRDVIPGSRNLNYTKQQQVLTNFVKKQQLPYEVPNILTQRHVSSWSFCVPWLNAYAGTRLYNCDPYTYTRCQEMYEKSYDKHSVRVLGGFHYDGLNICNSWDDNEIGIVAALHFRVDAKNKGEKS